MIQQKTKSIIKLAIILFSFLIIFSSCKKCYECTLTTECTSVNVDYYNGINWAYKNKRICSDDYYDQASYDFDVALAYAQFQSEYPGATVTKTVTSYPKSQEVCGSAKDTKSTTNLLIAQGYACTLK